MILNITILFSIIAFVVSQTSQAEGTRLQQKYAVREVLSTLGCSGSSCPINPDWSHPVECPTTEAELRLWSCDDAGNLEKLNLNSSVTGIVLQGSIHNAISQLSGLASLNLANNRIGGEIGGRLSTLSNLRRLVLANNSFSEPMPTLPSDGRLTHVDLSFNSFTGRFTLATNLPTTTVNYLDIRSNNFTGIEMHSIGSPNFCRLYVSEQDIEQGVTEYGDGNCLASGDSINAPDNCPSQCNCLSPYRCVNTCTHEYGSTDLAGCQRQFKIWKRDLCQTEYQWFTTSQRPFVCGYCKPRPCANSGEHYNGNVPAGTEFGTCSQNLCSSAATTTTTTTTTTVTTTTKKPSFTIPELTLPRPTPSPTTDDSNYTPTRGTGATDAPATTNDATPLTTDGTPLTTNGDPALTTTTDEQTVATPSTVNGDVSTASSDTFYTGQPPETDPENTDTNSTPIDVTETNDDDDKTTTITTIEDPLDTTTPSDATTIENFVPEGNIGEINKEESSSGFPIWAIAVIAVVALLLIGGIIALIVMKTRGNDDKHAPTPLESPTRASEYGNVTAALNGGDVDYSAAPQFATDVYGAAPNMESNYGAAPPLHSEYGAAPPLNTNTHEYGVAPPLTSNC